MIVANASGRGEPYVVWMVFASLVVVGLSTLLQVRRLGFVGAGAVLPMFTAAFAIPFCITAVVDGGPATLTTLLLVSAGAQLAISRWLFILRRVVTPTVSGTVMMILYLEFTNPRRMRFQSRLHIDALPELNAFIARFADRRGWDDPMKDRLSAVAEETLLTLAPLDLEGLLEGNDGDEDKEERQLIVLASSEGPVADLEFIGGGDDENMEDRIRQLQQHDSETMVEQDVSLRLLRNYASSVRHQQFHDTDIITVRVDPPRAR